jgi:hypothetical protein
VPRLGLMLLASAGSVLVAAVTPIAWPLQLLVGAAIYLLLVWGWVWYFPKTSMRYCVLCDRPSLRTNYG